MSDIKVWFITGAARGMGIDIAQAALGAGHAVVATARDAHKVTEVLGEHENLLPFSLDVTDPDAAAAATQAAVDRFGRIDVLVNNAGNFYAGFFEEISPQQFRQQMETNFFGPLNVTRAILPVMRSQRSGHVITLSSTAGLVGQEFVAAYCASKFALEGWMESIRFDLAPYGIHTTVVEPGFFRTELLVEGASTNWPELSILDYADRTKNTIEAWKRMNGKVVTRPSSPQPCSPSQVWSSRRCAGWPVPTPSAPPSRRRTTSSPRPTPTASCRPPSPTTTSDPRPRTSEGFGVPMTPNLSGTVALVTGASDGVGEAIARRPEDGACVVLAARCQDRLQVPR